MSIQQDTVLVRLNDEHERIGLYREMLGDRWFFDCDDCDKGSPSYATLSRMVRAFVQHNKEYHATLVAQTEKRK